jgi:hypothetical protein
MPPRRLPTARHLGVLAVLIALAALGAGASVHAQADTLTAYRWVGTHQGRPLWLDFYGDSMLVVDDVHVCSYRVTRDSLEAQGDTTFAVSYSVVLDRVLLETPEGAVVTMARQDHLARPMHGQWRGSEIGGTGRRIEMYLRRGGPARYRELPGGTWIRGEWNRRSRQISFVWLPDSLTWTGMYDPGGAALQVSDTTGGGSTIILRHVIR